MTYTKTYKYFIIYYIFIYRVYILISIVSSASSFCNFHIFFGDMLENSFCFCFSAVGAPRVAFANKKSTLVTTNNAPHERIGFQRECNVTYDTKNVRALKVNNKKPLKNGCFWKGVANCKLQI